MEKKILIIYPYYHAPDGSGSSGVKTALLNYTKNYSQESFRFFLALPFPSPHDTDFKQYGIDKIIYLNRPYHLCFELNRISPVYLLKYFFRLLGTIRQFKKIIREYRINLVYSHSSTFIGAAIAAKLLRIPSIIHLHEYGFRLPKFINKIYKIIIPRLGNQIICCADFIRQSLIKRAKNKDKIYTVYNTTKLVESQIILTKTDSLKKEFNIPKDNLVVGFVGRMAPKKGLHYLLKASKDIINKCPNTTFMIVGDIDEDYEKKYKEYLFNLCQRNKLGNKVVFAGARSDMLKVYSIMDILVFPSPVDMGPIVPIEAMACGVPVVSASEGGAQEEVKDGLTGIQVKPRDTKGISEAVICLLKNESLRQQMSFQARQWALEKFSLSQYVKKIDSIIYENFTH